ncbi:PadR family transcriptional regulator [Thermocatellispora tengchongensis]|uniref:PadR family transcriptional regulator n=1 Tax=Thermocatellispora tengchongensis TaxID=1073253 RepID=UPI0028B1AD3C|nr:PadR family transcriptional regulator [Thermocatellispora tengchongensis]
MIAAGNPGQIYVTLARLEKAGLVVCERADGLPERPDREVYALTPAGQQRVAAWLAEVGWPSRSSPCWSSTPSRSGATAWTAPPSCSTTPPKKSRRDVENPSAASSLG